MTHRTEKSASRAVLYPPLLAALIFAACGSPRPLVQPHKVRCETRPRFRDSNLIPHEVEFFDRLITQTATLTDPIRQRLTHALPPLSKNGQRHYTFILGRQPEMDPETHFDVITVSVARAGTLLKSPLSQPATSSLGGSNGAFSDATIQTPDGAYDLRISEGTLLPRSVEISPFYVSAAVIDLSRRYEKAVNARKRLSCGNEQTASLR